MKIKSIGLFLIKFIDLRLLYDFPGAKSIRIIQSKVENMSNKGEFRQYSCNFYH